MSKTPSIIWDADALLFIANASITDTTQKSAINTLVTDLKIANIWTKMKAVYPMVGGTASQHRFNLKDPRTEDAAYYLTFYNGWTHNLDGANGNPSDVYADTKFTGLTNNSSLSYYNKYTGLDNTNILMGVYNNPDVNSAIASNLGGNSIFTIRSNTNLQYTSIANKGFWIANRQNQTNINAWHNGVKTGTSTTSSSSSPQTGAIYLNSYNAGTPSYPSKAICAFASIADGLTDTEASNFYTAVQAYQTTLGRQV
jgi:hypothetical protein